MPLEEGVKIIDSLSVKRSNQSEPLNGEHEKRAENDQPLNDSVKRIDLKGYSNYDLELIDLLWKHSTVKRNDQLETRDNVLKIIGDNKTNTLRLRKLFSPFSSRGLFFFYAIMALYKQLSKILKNLQKVP